MSLESIGFFLLKKGFRCRLDQCRRAHCTQGTPAWAHEHTVSAPPHSPVRGAVMTVPTTTSLVLGKLSWKWTLNWRAARRRHCTLRKLGRHNWAEQEAGLPRGHNQGPRGSTRELRADGLQSYPQMTQAAPLCPHISPSLAGATPLEETSSWARQSPAIEGRASTANMPTTWVPGVLLPWRGDVGRMSHVYRHHRHHLAGEPRKS